MNVSLFLKAAQKPALPDRGEDASEGLVARSRQRASDAWYAASSRGQAAGNSLLHWCSVALLWLKDLWAKLVEVLMRVWEWAKTPFIRKAA